MEFNNDYEKIGYDIIGAAFSVHQTAGSGLRENYYHAALLYELTQKGYDVKSEVTLPALYKGIEIKDAYQADIVVNDRVIIELKAVDSMWENEGRQLLTYLTVSNFKLGYLINFGATNFSIGKSDDALPHKKGIYRFVNGL